MQFPPALGAGAADWLPVLAGKTVAVNDVAVIGGMLCVGGDGDKVALEVARVGGMLGAEAGGNVDTFTLLLFGGVLGI